MKPYQNKHMSSDIDAWLEIPTSERKKSDSCMVTKARNPACGVTQRLSKC